MRRPNILLVYADQLRWDAVGANGNPDVRTPVIDSLAATGANFDHCFVQNPVCMPSRVSMLSGRYPSALGITHMGVPVPDDVLVLPRMLHPFGYRTGNLGKLHFLPHANRDHRDPHPSYGFDVLELSEEPGPYEDAYRAWVRQRAPEHLDAVSLGLPKAAQAWHDALGIEDGISHPAQRFPKRAMPFRAPDDLTHGAFVADRTAQFIRESAGRPWLAVASFYSPHSPWVAPQRFLDLYDPERLALPELPPELAGERDPEFDETALRSARHGYFAMVSEVDEHIGTLLGVLDELGERDDTIVVLVADHGEWLGDSLRYGKGFPASDPVSRVPFVLNWPGGNLRAAVTDLVEAVDVVPTLLELAGIPIPSPVQGRSLLPLVRGAGAARGSALTESAGWRSLRTASHRYVARADGTELLFDLGAEFGQDRDVAADPGHAGELAAVRGELVRRMIEAEQPLPRTWPY
jgi:arylsulfatase A-like enzyme